MTANWSLRASACAARRAIRSASPSRPTSSRSTADRRRQAGARVRRRAGPAARPARVRHGDGQSGDRCRGLAQGCDRAGWHPLAAQPFDFDGDTQLVGLAQFRAEILDRALQGNPAGQRPHRGAQREAVKQGDLLAVASGTLKLTPQGYLDGDLTVTATGIEKLLRRSASTLWRAGARQRAARRGAELLDRMAPGAVRARTRGSGDRDGLRLMSEAAELEGRRAARCRCGFTTTATASSRAGHSSARRGRLF